MLEDWISWIKGLGPEHLDIFVTAVTAIAVAFISAIVTLSIARKGSKIETNKEYLSFLKIKIQKLTEANERMIGGIKEGSTENYKELADFLSNRYSVTTDVFETIRHLLPKKKVKELSHNIERITATMAIETVKDMGLMDDPSEWNGEEPFNINDLPIEMSSIADDIENIIVEELSKATNEIIDLNGK